MGYFLFNVYRSLPNGAVYNQAAAVLFPLKHYIVTGNKTAAA